MSPVSSQMPVTQVKSSSLPGDEKQPEFRVLRATGDDLPTSHSPSRPLRRRPRRSSSSTSRQPERDGHANHSHAERRPVGKALTDCAPHLDASGYTATSSVRNRTWCASSPRVEGALHHATVAYGCDRLA